MSLIIIKSYFKNLFDINSTITIVLSLQILLAAIVWLMFKRKRLSLAILLISYFFFVFFVTVLSRSTNEYVKCSWPLSSYMRIYYGDKFLFLQVVMNVVMFVPVGFLFKVISKEWSWKRVISVGMILSILIECFQLVLMKGTVELDDVIHNTIGCAIGVFLFEGMQTFFRILHKRI